MAASLKLFREQKAPWAPGGLPPPPHATILFLLRPLPGCGGGSEGKPPSGAGARPRLPAPAQAHSSREKQQQASQELSRAPTEHLTGRELSWELHARSVLSDNPI